MDKTPTRLRFIKWYDTPADQRNPYEMKGFAGLNHVNLSTLYTWEKQIKKARGVIEDKGDKKEKFIQHLESEVYSSKCPVKRQELYASLKGWKVEKQEVDLKIGLSAEEHLRIREEAVRRVQELNNRTTDGDTGLLDKPAVLLEDIRKD